MTFTPPDSPASIQFGNGLRALAQLLHETADHHGSFEAAVPPHDCGTAMRPYLDARQRGSTPEAASTAAGRYMAEVKHVVA